MSNDPLDDLLRALSAPARGDELAGEADAVAQMRSVLTSTDAKGLTTVHASSSRRTRIATLVAAGVIGFGGVAAAGPGNFLPSSGDSFLVDAPADKPTETTEPSTSTVPETTAAPTTEPETVPETVPSTTPETTAAAAPAAPSAADVPVDDPDTEFDETQCADGNHGKTVSSVAQAVEPGPGHGDEVSVAAQSSCGKDAADDESDDDDADESSSTSADDDSDDDGGKPAGAGSQGNGHGKPADPGSQGNGRGRSGKDD